MQHENNKQNESASGKAVPQNVSGKNEEQAKEKTEPLASGDNQSIDQEEGNMHNGEVGGTLGKLD